MSVHAVRAPAQVISLLFAVLWDSFRSNMVTPLPAKLRVVLLLFTLVLYGCSTPDTTVRLTGSEGSQVSGQYRATHVSSHFTGSANWQMNFGQQRLEEFEFQKGAAEQSVDLEIRRGGSLLVQATSQPGTSGLRVRRDQGWKVETVR